MWRIPISTEAVRLKPPDMIPAAFFSEKGDRE
jgi:hypothetical protein